MNTLRYIPINPSNIRMALDIYNHYIEHSTATFHTEHLTIDEMLELIYTNHPVYDSYLLELNGETAGFTYLGPFRKRQAYDRTAEVTIYLHKDFYRKGIATEALNKMEVIAREKGLANLLAGITGDNSASLSLFKKLGYFECARYRNVGEKFGKVLDVVFYQKILE